MTRFLCRLHFGHSEGGHSPLMNQFFNASLVGGRPAILIFSRGELSTIAVLVQTLDNAVDSPLAEGFFDGLFVVQGRFFGPLFVEYQPHPSEFMVVVASEPTSPLIPFVHPNLFDQKRSSTTDELRRLSR